jgi:tetratricopeptide (TPR) repeat protein
MRLLARIASAACAVAALVGLLGLAAPTVEAQRRRTPPAEQPAASTNSRDNEARMLFEAGRVAYSAGRFDDALGYFRRAHEISGRAMLLYNVGSAADKLRQDVIALDAFRRYLEAVPDAENREEVEARVRVLEGVLASQARTTAATTTGATTTAATTTGATTTGATTTGATTPTTATTPAATTDTASTTPPRTPPPRTTTETGAATTAATAAATATNTVPTPAATAAAAQVRGADATADASLAAGSVPTEPVRDGESRSIFSRWWFWTIVGVAVAGATVGVVAATTGGDTLGPFQPGDDGSVYMTLVSP